MNTWLLSALMFLAGAVQTGKVVVRTGVPGAEILLDGTPVGTTDAKGELVMESFPAGTFRFAVRKPGYEKYSGHFAVTEGETRIVRVELQPAASETPRVPKTPRTKAAAENAAPRPPPEPVPPPATPSLVRPPPPPSTPPVSAPEEPAGDSNWWYVGGAALVAAAAYILWRWRRQAATRPILAPNLEHSEAEGPPATASRPAPEFIDHLKRKEELMEAGYVPIKTRDASREQPKEKEIVIVLPKEAYEAVETDERGPAKTED